MKILQLMSGQLMSGAGRGALALHKGLMALSIESRLFGRLEKQLPAGVEATRFCNLQRLQISVRNRLYLRALRARHGQPESLFHPISHGHAPHRHRLFDWADLVHVQWAQAATLGPGFWRALPTVPRPLVFTLRDMWVFTGGCHFSADCLGYESDCGRCDLLGGEQDITARDLALKRAAVAPRPTPAPGVAPTLAPTFVAISRTIADQARRSTVLRDADIRLIPNSVDTGAFAALDKPAARAALGLPASGFIVATGALCLSERRKGAAVMARVLAALGNRPDIHWAVFGADPWPLPPGATWFGLVDNNARLNQILSAADLFVMPSLQESFGKTSAEALAAGTPVLAFDHTPAEEIIQHGETGWVVAHADSDALVRGILAAAALDPAELAARGRMGRQRVLARYAPEVVAGAHVALYAGLVEAHRRIAPAAAHRPTASSAASSDSGRIHAAA